MGSGGASTENMVGWCKKLTVRTTIRVSCAPSKDGDVRIIARLILNPSFPARSNDCESGEGGGMGSGMSSDDSFDDDNPLPPDTPTTIAPTILDRGTAGGKSGCSNGWIVELSADLIPREARECLGVVVRIEREDPVTGTTVTSLLGRVYPGDLMYGGGCVRLTRPRDHLTSKLSSPQLQGVEVYARMSAPSNRSKQQSHLLLVGPPGVGKSTAAGLIANELFGSRWQHEGGLKPVVRLNASNLTLSELKSRIRGMMDRAAKERFEEYPFCLIILEEIAGDNHASRTRQEYLRRPMETASDRIRFIFTANYKSCMIPALQSRVQTVQFQRVHDRACSRSNIERVLSRHRETVKYALTIDDRAVEMLHRISRGDMRVLIKYLHMAFASARRDVRRVVSSGVAASGLYRARGMVRIEDWHVMEWAGGECVF